MAQKINTLLAEDDKNLGVILKKYLEAKDIAVTLCANGEEALNTFKEKGDFNFCIFDLMMPVMDGFTLSKEVKKINKRIPIIFLTAKTSQKDILEGFSLGADDYITKPFSMDELLMRIHAVFNRSSQDAPAPTTFKLGSFTFDAPRHLLIKGEESRKLTSKEADLLLLLCENMNRPSSGAMPCARFGAKTPISMRARWMSISPSSASISKTIRTWIWSMSTGWVSS